MDLPEALLPNEDDDCRTWLMSWTPTVLGGDLEACLGACVQRLGAGMCVLVIVHHYHLHIAPVECLQRLQNSCF